MMTLAMNENKSTANPRFEWLTKKVALLLSFVLVIVPFLIAIAMDAFADYTGTIIRQRQEFLLEISKNASRAIEVYVHGQVESQQFLCEAINDKNYKEFIDAYYTANKNSVFGMTLYDEDGGIVYDAPQGCEEFMPEISSFDASASDGTAIIGKSFKVADKSFVLPVLHNIKVNGELKYNLIAVIDVGEIYHAIIEPIKTGVRGYTMVKDSEGTIIMHPVDDQVGLDAIEGRRSIYPDLDYTDLEELIDRQMKGEEGYALYKSYWWADDVPHQVDKVSGFAPAKIGSDFWVVNTTLDYKELDFPVSRTLRNLVAVVFAITGIFIVTIVILFKIQRDRRSLSRELKHLEELSTALEDLQSSKQQLTHYQQLKTIGTFTSGIAHEINNLLTPIMGYSEIMLKTLPEADESHNDAHEIYDASIKAKEIIEQILAFSRPVKGMDLYKYKDINNVINRSVKLIKSFLPQNIELIADNNARGFVYCNETQITQALINVLTNGYQSMEQNGGVLSISSEIVDKSAVKNPKDDDVEHYVKIKISDTGCGIEEKNISEIFSPFFTTKPVGQGTGLGLSVVQGVVLRHKGEISVASVIGEGTSFTVCLPYHKEAAHHEDDTTSSKKFDKKLNILFVDDDKKIGPMMRRMLDKAMYSVDAYSDPVLVTELYNEQLDKYDLIITDYHMPQLNGIQLSRIIKQRFPDKKIILISGYLDEEVEGYLQENIIDGYLMKPINKQNLCRLIEEIL